jgi:hypothetical protein
LKWLLSDSIGDMEALIVLATDFATVARKPWDHVQYFGHVTAVPATVGPFSNRASPLETRGMAEDSTRRKDTLKVEKLSLLVLTLCIVVLVYLLVERPF